MTTYTHARDDSARTVLTRARGEVLHRKQVADSASRDAAESEVRDIALERGERDRAISIMIDEDLRRIDDALSRIDNGTYGICARCGEKIPPRRLQALPFATLCVSCQTLAEHSPARTGSPRAEHRVTWSPDHHDLGPRHRSEPSLRRENPPVRAPDDED